MSYFAFKIRILTEIFIIRSLLLLYPWEIYFQIFSAVLLSYTESKVPPAIYEYKPPFITISKYAKVTLQQEIISKDKRFEKYVCKEEKRDWREICVLVAMSTGNK